ncbi:FAD-dependent monooxygenase [Noviherbaspirillum massiliense]|uniref:FAD-dependent monooxygenase n=1 Tax=Noviherbaspirillum massiliense TaxID=1465823 RepID=UPI0002EABA8C|nr:FAD-dependent monooxygenase [Noviherbaspirillum massiliense]
METDILIVGAGPTGLMLANQLLKHDIRAVIVDRNPGPSVQTKALGVQARTLEIYSQLGIAEEAVELGKRATGANMWVQGRRAARVPLGDIGQDLSPYPFLLILGQDDNERLLGTILRDRGTDIQWNTKLVGLEQAKEGVTATLEQADGRTLEIEAKWVAGCDGAHSAVRSLCNIDFVGAPYEDLFYVADTIVTGSMTPDELNIYLWPRGFHLFFPMRGENHWRVVGIVPPELLTRSNIDFDAVEPYIRNEAGTALRFQECSWFSTYHVHHRRAARFRDRRCFLLGDAAHVHSPVGAQGMNTGLQDAYNLAWKLALVVSGQAEDGLLDSYDLERAPVASRLLRTTDRAFTFFVSERWYAEVFRMRIFPRAVAIAMHRERARKLAFRTISQIGIRYPRSPLSRMAAQLPGDAPCAGDRFPWMRLQFAPNGPVEDLFQKLDDTCFSLMLFGQSLPAGALSDQEMKLIAICTIPDTPENKQALAHAQIPRPSFYLLRPDGHVGLAGTQLDMPALKDYLRERVKLRMALAEAEPREEAATHGRP